MYLLKVCKFPKNSLTSLFVNSVPVLLIFLLQIYIYTEFCEISSFLSFLEVI